MTWEAQDDGFVAKILVEAGAQDVKVGEPVIVIVEEEVRVHTQCACHTRLPVEAGLQSLPCLPDAALCQACTALQRSSGAGLLRMQQRMGTCTRACLSAESAQGDVAAFEGFTAADAGDKPTPKEAPKKAAQPPREPQAEAKAGPEPTQAPPSPPQPPKQPSGARPKLLHRLCSLPCVHVLGRCWTHGQILQ